jgi:hypothetical protein
MIGLVVLVVLAALVVLLPTARAQKAVAIGTLLGLAALAVVALLFLRGPERTSPLDLPPAQSTGDAPG